MVCGLLAMTWPSCVVSGSGPADRILLSASRSVKMPAIRLFSTTSKAPIRRSVIRRQATRTVVSLLAVTSTRPSSRLRIILFGMFCLLGQCGVRQPLIEPWLVQPKERLPCFDDNDSNDHEDDHHADQFNVHAPPEFLMGHFQHDPDPA